MFQWLLLSVIKRVLIQPWLQAVPRCAERLISLSEDLKLPLILLSRRKDLAVGMFQREMTVVRKIK